MLINIIMKVVEKNEKLILSSKPKCELYLIVICDGYCLGCSVD